MTSDFLGDSEARSKHFGVRALSAEEVSRLSTQGCSCEDWSYKARRFRRDGSPFGGRGIAHRNKQCNDPQLHNRR